MTRNAKHLSFSLLAIAVSLALILLARRDAGSAGDAKSGLGAPVLPDLPVNDIKKIVIAKAGAPPVTLADDDDIWRVAELHGYPADFAKITALLRSLAALRSIQNVKADPKELPSFGFPPAAGVELQAFAATGKLLTTLLAGDRRLRRVSLDSEIPVGRHLLVPNHGGVKLSNDVLPELDGAAEDWLDKKFIATAALESAWLSQDGKVQWRVSAGRSFKDFFLEGADSVKADPEKLKAVGSCLGHLGFDTLAPATSFVAERDTVFNAVSFYGVRYTLQLGKTEGKYRQLRLKISLLPFQLPEGAKGMAPDKEAELRAKVARLRDDARLDQAEFGKWTYLVDAAKLVPMLYSRQELLTIPEKPKTSPFPFKVNSL